MTLDARDKAIVLAVWQQWAEHGRCTYRAISAATGIPWCTVWGRTHNLVRGGWVAMPWRYSHGQLSPGPLVGGVLRNRRTGERTLLRRIEG